MHSVIRSAARSALAHHSTVSGPAFRYASRPELAGAIQSRAFASKSKGKGQSKAATSSPEAPSDAPSPSVSGSASSASDASSSTRQAETEQVSENESSNASTPSENAPRSRTLSLDFSPAEEQSGEEGQTGARSSKDSLSSIEKRQKRLARIGMLALALGSAATVVFMGRDWEEGELRSLRLPPDSAPNTRYGRTMARFGSLFDFFSEPAWTELLPPPLPPPHQKPFTLLVSIDDLLVSSTWDRQHGWRTVKRPGVDYFIAYLSQFYEIVVFTTQGSFTAEPIVQKLDPYNYFITYRLYREATRMGKEGPVKDLSYLNRPLDKVILLDAHAEHATSHPENAIILKPWTGQRGDKGLIDMIPFLESIAIYQPNDIRPILKAYEGKDIPREYALKEAAEKRAVVEEWKARGGGKGLSGGGFTLSGLFGGKEQTPAVPETYLEKRRREAQANYVAEQTYFKEHKEEIEAMIQADIEARTKEMGGTIFGMMAGFAPKPPQEGATPTTASTEVGQPVSRS